MVLSLVAPLRLPATLPPPHAGGTHGGRWRSWLIVKGLMVAAEERGMAARPVEEPHRRQSSLLSFSLSPFLRRCARLAPLAPRGLHGCRPSPAPSVGEPDGRGHTSGRICACGAASSGTSQNGALRPALTAARPGARVRWVTRWVKPSWACARGPLPLLRVVTTPMASTASRVSRHRPLPPPLSLSSCAAGRGALQRWRTTRQRPPEVGPSRACATSVRRGRLVHLLEIANSVPPTLVACLIEGVGSAVFTV